MKDNIFISIICIVNDLKMYDGFVRSLNSQSFKNFELIPIMNTKGEYSSARKAFNEAAGSASGDYLLFSHPDIRFEDDDALKDVIRILKDDIPADFGAAGAAGAVKKGNSREILTAIRHGDDHSSVGTFITEPAVVQTLDECFFIIDREYFKKHPFSEKDGWHLYACEYCLEAIKDGRKNYTLPARLWHLSDGKSLNADYVLQINDLINEEKDHFDMICTTVKAWKTKGMFAFLFRKYYYVKQRVKSRLVK